MFTTPGMQSPMRLCIPGDVYNPRYAESHGPDERQPNPHVPDDERPLHAEHVLQLGIQSRPGCLYALQQPLVCREPRHAAADGPDDAPDAAADAEPCSAAADE